jgi:hypothetical protein
MKSKPEATGCSLGFNTAGLGEVIMGFDDDPDGTHNGADSMYIKDLEVLIDDKWICMSEAFRTKQLIPNNYNTDFRRPENEEERKLGYCP